MRVHLLGPERIEWPLGEREDRPCYSIKTGAYPTRLYVDPFPAYAADRALAEDLVAACAERAPLAGDDANLYLLSHESATRFNGQTYDSAIWDRPDGKRRAEMLPHLSGSGELRELVGQAHTIVLSVMPAMLRYLVAHEYGHAAFNKHERSVLEARYMEMRGAAPPGDEAYVGGAWHRSPGEIIANDFRLLVMQAEVEYWPHDVPRPELSGAVAEWWARAVTLAAGRERGSVVKRLVDLDPRWVGAGDEGVTHDGQPVPRREGVGLMLTCPGCGSEHHPLYVPFANPLDGGPQHGPQGWQRTGDMFETLTLSPSIQRMEECRWHGFIQNGEVKDA